MRRLAVLGLVVPLAACGSHKAAPKPQAPPSPAHLLGAGAHVLYSGGDWAVVTKGDTAIAAHRVGGAWKADRTGAVKLDVLGPDARVGSTPQVAVQMTAKSHLIEEGLWVDGVELIEKGGGLTPEKVTVYGAPDGKLKPGKHRAVAYGRTDTHGSAVTWTFTVV